MEKILRREIKLDTLDTKINDDSKYDLNDELYDELIDEILCLIIRNQDKVLIEKEWEDGEGKKKLVITNASNTIITKKHLDILIILVKMHWENIDLDDIDNNLCFYYKFIAGEYEDTKNKKISFPEIFDLISELSTVRILYHYEDEGISHDFSTGIINNFSICSVSKMEERLLIESGKRYGNCVSVNSKFIEYILSYLWE